MCRILSAHDIHGGLFYIIGRQNKTKTSPQRYTAAPRFFLPTDVLQICAARLPPLATTHPEYLLSNRWPFQLVQVTAVEASTTRASRTNKNIHKRTIRRGRSARSALRAGNAVGRKHHPEKLRVMNVYHTPQANSYFCWLTRAGLERNPPFLCVAYRKAVDFDAAFFKSYSWRITIHRYTSDRTSGPRSYF